MSTRVIDGYLLDSMVKSGLAYLRTKENEINKLNVFPVADGDTGTNMCLTLSKGVSLAKQNTEVAPYLMTLSNGMLLGARGNSGVILSQFFKGFYTGLSRCRLIGPGELRRGLITGYRAAYAAVLHPVEGTMLTVMREGIEKIRTQITRNTSMEVFFSMYIAEMKKTLLLTPEMLPVLKQSGVVDSGAVGFITLFEGMLKCLYGEAVLPVQTEEPTAAPREDAIFSLMDENSVFTDGYCMEFVLQLLNAAQKVSLFRIADFNASLSQMGNSIVAIRDENRVKVHIHTLKPETVIAFCRRYGEFLTFHLENMQLQCLEKKQEEAAEAKPLSIVAVVNGEGLKTVFQDLGCDIVLDGGATMNTSAQEFVEVFEKSKAKRIVVFPNSPNITGAAEQAVRITGAENVVIIPTKTIVQGYNAIAMDVADSEDIDARIEGMRREAGQILTLAEATASRDYVYREISCHKGDEILLADNTLVGADAAADAVIVKGIGNLPDIRDKESCVIFRGMHATEEDGEHLRDLLTERCPWLETEVVYGGQEIYTWLIGIL